MKPSILAVTPGEPAGIGVDLLLKVIQSSLDCELVAYADPQLLRDRAALLDLPLRLREPRGRPLEAGELAVHPVAMATPATPGRPDTRNAAYVLETLRLATEACLEGQVAGLVTGPVHKAVINEAGIPFSGHTEFLARHTGTAQVVMMLASGSLRVALATTHLPLRAVPDAITRELLESVLHILDRDLRGRFGLQTPRILVCGLNPHAGEGGHLGREEIDVIAPALAAVSAKGIDVSGPHPADTLFTPASLAGGDVVLAMYHDQGLPVLKHQGFGNAVNVTLGLPIIRTSVDHGTALEIAGTGYGDPGSLVTAINTALQMAALSPP